MALRFNPKWILRGGAFLLVVACVVVIRFAWMHDAKPIVKCYRWLHDTSRIDFDLPLEAIDGSKRDFSEFRRRNVLLFYFSPTCGHCQKTYLRIREFRDEYRSDSLEFVAVATGKASAEDISAFVSEFRLDMPAFQDKSRRFSKLYNTGRVPLVLLVSRDGTFEAWNSAESTTVDSVEQAIRRTVGR